MREDPGALAMGFSALEACVRQWDLQIGDPLEGATCSFLFEVEWQGREAVLKVPLAHDEKQAAREVMRPYSGHGGVPLLAFDEATGACLMERLRPATNLAEEFGFDDRATRIAASLMGSIHRAPPVAQTTVADWVAELDQVEPKGCFIDAILPEAKALARELLETTSQQVLLHGDLHHFNILRHGEEWFVVDPKGLVGDPAFEPVGFLRNPFDRFHEIDLVAVQRQRVLTFAEVLQQPASRVWGWGWTMNVLSSLGWTEPGDRFFDAVNQAVWALYQLKDEFAETFA